MGLTLEPSSNLLSCFSLYQLSFTHRNGRVNITVEKKKKENFSNKIHESAKIAGNMNDNISRANRSASTSTINTSDNSNDHATQGSGWMKESQNKGFDLNYMPIYLSSYCTHPDCSRYITENILVSDETWKMSFAKFLEITHYNQSARVWSSVPASPSHDHPGSLATNVTGGDDGGLSPKLKSSSLSVSSEEIKVGATAASHSSKSNENVTSTNPSRSTSGGGTTHSTNAGVDNHNEVHVGTETSIPINNSNRSGSDFTSSHHICVHSIRDYHRQIFSCQDYLAAFE